MTSNWVLTGECANFPLLYHWRILPAKPGEPSAEDLAGIAEMVEYWAGSAAAGVRLDAIARASATERGFLELNATHDAAYVEMRLVNWLVEALDRPGDTAARNAYIRAVAERGVPDGVPDWAAAAIRRYAPVATVLNDFYWQLHGESRTAPYPSDEVERLLTSGIDR